MINSDLGAPAARGRGRWRGPVLGWALLAVLGLGGAHALPGVVDRLMQITGWREASATAWWNTVVAGLVALLAVALAPPVAGRAPRRRGGAILGVAAVAAYGMWGWAGAVADRRSHGVWDGDSFDLPVTSWTQWTNAPDVFQAGVVARNLVYAAALMLAVATWSYLRGYKPWAYLALVVPPLVLTVAALTETLSGGEVMIYARDPAFGWREYYWALQLGLPLIAGTTFAWLLGLIGRQRQAPVQ